MVVKLLETAREEGANKLQNIKELNIASSIVRRDMRQILNVPIRDYFGNNLKGKKNLKVENGKK